MKVFQTVDEKDGQPMGNIYNNNMFSKQAYIEFSKIAIVCIDVTMLM